MKWVRSLNSESGNTTIKEAKELTNISKNVQKRIMTGDKSLILPLISYYGTGRLYAQKKECRRWLIVGFFQVIIMVRLP